MCAFSSEIVGKCEVSPRGPFNAHYHETDLTTGECRCLLTGKIIPPPPASEGGEEK